jgi:hypothetical protein
MSAEVNKCVICDKIYYGYGNNARPLKEGRCCDPCNKLVIAERIQRLYSDHHMQELMKKYNNGDFDNDVTRS